MATIVSARAAQPSRIAVELSTGSPSTSVADYTVTRRDGVWTPITVETAFLPVGKPSSVVLCLSDPMIDGIEYAIAVSGAGSAVVGYRAPAVPVSAPTEEDDPETELLGLDLAWITDELGPDGDIPRRKGRDSYVHDMQAIAVINPGELAHRPLAGASLQQLVNGPSTELEVSLGRARLSAAWLADPRTKRASTDLTERDGGTVFLAGEVEDNVLGESTPIALGG